MDEIDITSAAGAGNANRRVVLTEDTGSESNIRIATFSEILDQVALDAWRATDRARAARNHGGRPCPVAAPGDVNRAVTACNPCHADLLDAVGWLHMFGRTAPKAWTAEHYVAALDASTAACA